MLSARRAGRLRLLLGRLVRLQPRAPFHIFFPHRDTGMAVMLLLFVLVVLYHRTPKQSTCPAPAVDKDPVFEPLVTRGHDERVVFACCVRIRFTPVEDERLALALYQFRPNVLGPVPTPAALSHADIIEKHRKLRVENDTVFF